MKPTISYRSYSIEEIGGILDEIIVFDGVEYILAKADLLRNIISIQSVETDELIECNFNELLLSGAKKRDGSPFGVKIELTLDRLL